MMYLKLAWRNMWRSRRRTVITVSSIFFAVILAIAMRVFIVGLFEKMIADTVSMSCGYLQIHHIGYWDNKTIDSSFDENPKLTTILNKEANISAWAPRLESFALASSGEKTKGILVTGIEPVREDSFSHLSQKIISGKYINDSDKSIILAEGLAQYLNLKVNDTVVLLGQGYQGNMAAGKYLVKGIVRLAIPDMNKSMAWLPMKTTRDFLSTGAKLTSISLMLSNRNNLDEVKQNIISQTKGDNYEVMTWQEMLPELDQLFKAKMGQNVIMSGILYLVIAFGIFGTILMMLNERRHEFGILIAIGMKKNMLAMVVVMEMILMSVFGALLGIIGAIPLVYYFKIHPIRFTGSLGEMIKGFNMEPIMPPATEPSHFILQAYIVLSISIVLSVFAVYKIYKLKAIAAINS